jgi:hypothetical protein
MTEWRKKLRFWRDDAKHLARPMGVTGSGEGRPAQQMPNPTEHVANETPDAAQSEENAFGVKLLVPGEAPTVE